MPTYQYVCTDCREPLEAQQSFSDPPLSVCPTCEGRLRKVFGAVGVVFKGSGFYRTDSRAAETKAAANGDSARAGKDGGAESAKEASMESTSGSKSGDAGSSGSDAKPDAKPAAKAAAKDSAA